MDHITKVSSLCMDQSSAPSLDVTKPDPQFGMNEEYDAYHVGAYILHLIIATFPVLASGCCRFDL